MERCWVCRSLLPTRGRPALSQGAGSPKETATLSIFVPPLPLQMWTLGPGYWALADLWMLVLLNHVCAHRASLRTAMEWISYLLDPIHSLNFEDR